MNTSNIEQLVLSPIKIKRPYDTMRKTFEEFVDRASIELPDHDSFDELDELLRSHYKIERVLPLRLALKIIKARDFVRHGLKHNVRVDVISPVYREIGRMSPPSLKNPYGENSLVEKINLLQNLEKISMGRLEITFWVVDDVCPEGSGRFAEKILKQHFPSQFCNKYKVLFL